MSTRQNNATENRVYGGDCGLIHIADGERKVVGQLTALHLEHLMRDMAYEQGRRNIDEANSQDLCPGCYMVAIFDAAVNLAQKFGQPLPELAASMAKAFTKLADCQPGDDACIEEIEVVLDNDGDKSCPVPPAPAGEVTEEITKIEDQVKAGLR